MKSVLPRLAGVLFLFAITKATAGDEKVHLSLRANLGHDLSDAFALAYIVALPNVELNLFVPSGKNPQGSNRILTRFLWLTGSEDPVLTVGSGSANPEPPDPSGMFQFGLRPSGRRQAPIDLDQKPDEITSVDLTGKVRGDDKKMSVESLEKLFSTGTPLANALWSLHELAGRDPPSLAGAERIAAVAGTEFSEDEFIRLVGAYTAHNEVPNRVEKPLRNLSEPVDAGGFPNRVHVIENYQTEIERRWWLSGQVIQSDNVNRYCQGLLTRNFDGKMGDPTRIYHSVIFNPVPGPPMGPNTRLKFRYRIEGADWIQCQIFSLSKGFHRYTTIENLPQGEWQTAVVDMTKARRPDGSGGPLLADERIDDIQFYTDPKAELFVDDIVLYGVATGKTEEPFPEDFIFTGWFDTGKQGKEWPGDFEIVPHEKPRTWDAARSVTDPKTGEPWIRAGLRGLRPAGGGFRVRFDYRLRGSGPIEVFGFNSKDRSPRLESRRKKVVKDPVMDVWSTAEVTIEWPLDAAAGQRVPPLPAEFIDEVHFRVSKDCVLEIDNLLIYRRNRLPSTGFAR